MKQDRIAKLYEGLSNKELAAIAFCHLTSANELELERVTAAVPRKTYRCLNFEYQQLLDGKFNMAAYWAIQHWKLHAQRLATQCKLLLLRGENSHEDVLATSEEFKCCESRLLALDLALLAICEVHCIEPDAVRRFAGAEPFSAIFANLSPDLEFQTDMQANLALALGVAQRQSSNR